MSDLKLFHWADYLVFGIFLIVSASVGFIIGWKDRKKKTAKDFLTGGKSMHWLPTALSMQATFVSGVYVLSTPVETYYFGTMYFFLALGCAIASPLSSHVFLAIYYKLNLVSVYEYLETRFNKAVRMSGAATFCIMVLLYNSVLLYSPAMALAQVTGLSINISILLCGTVCTIYTTLGGMKGTIWIDFLQMLVLFLSLVTIIILGVIKVGGISNVWEANVRGGRIILDNFQIDPTLRNTFWTQVIGGGTGAVALWISSQVIVQKFISVKSLNDAHKSMYFNILTNLIFTGLASLVGLIAYAYFEGCDPLLSGKITKHDQIVAVLVMEISENLYGLPGMFMAAIFSAALSSLAGGLTALSAVTVIDFILPIYHRHKERPMAEPSRTILTRALMLMYGMVAIGTGYATQFMGSSILQITISIFGFVGGPLTSLIVLGVLFPFVNSWGVLAGLISSLTVSSWLAIGSVLSKSPLPILSLSSEGCPIGLTTNSSLHYLYNSTVRSLSTESNFQDMTTPMTYHGEGGSAIPWYYRISYFYYSAISLAVAMIVAIPVSFITGRAKDVDRKLTFNCFDNCSCCCPNSRETLKCGNEVAEEVDDRNKNGTNEDKLEDCHSNRAFEKENDENFDSSRLHI